MAKDKVATIKLEDVEIIFRNFSGRPGPFNAAGVKSFSVILPDEKSAQQLLKDGWNVKYTKPREEGDEGVPYLGVAVRYDFKPPRIVMISGNVRTNITEEMVEILDAVDIQTVDLICNASVWDVNGKSGIKAYLKTMFVTINEDELEQKYAVNTDG